MQLLEIGYFSRTHGVKGQLLLRTQYDLELENLKTVFVERSGAKEPHFIESVRASKDALVVSLEDITTVELARPLLNKPVFVASSLVVESNEDDDLSGYELHDRNFGPVGTIKSMEFHGAQELFLVEHNGAELLLPAVDDLIEEIDDDRRVVRYNAPEGLIEMLLGR